MTTPATRDLYWPALPLDGWNDTYATLHMWMQIVGKVRLSCSPWINHSWHTTLYVTSRGLTTSPIPFGERAFDIDFDFIDHQLLIRTHDGGVASFPLHVQTVASFYAQVMGALGDLGLRVRIHAAPNEVADAVPFERDDTHRAYDREYANRFWRILIQSDRLFKSFRARFVGKCSPVHLFWGALDLAVTRFSGRRAPVHPGGIPNLPDRVAREAYSHEVSSCGFWPGGGALPYPVYYAYAYPEPTGFAEATVRPQEALYSTDFREFILPYDTVRQAANPDETLLVFLQSTYAAAADRAGWDRAALEVDHLP